MSRHDARARVRRGWWHVSLRFRQEVTQSRMWRWFPDLLDVGYTRTMLAALLLNPRPRHIGIVGLGGGSQAKFCHRWLAQAQVEAIESNPEVLALREAFGIPADGERFRVTLGDAARVLKQRGGAYDLLLLDAYDEQGIPAALGTRDFYCDCRASLREGGVLACNLFDTETHVHLAHLRAVFGGKVAVLAEPKASNQVGFAWTGTPVRTGVSGALAGLPWLARWQLRQGIWRLASALDAHGP